jgi:hypothetical protein
VATRLDVSGRRYGRVTWGWCAIRDSNPEPADFRRALLSTTSNAPTMPLTSPNPRRSLLVSAREIGELPVHLCGVKRGQTSLSPDRRFERGVVTRSGPLSSWLQPGREVLTMLT